MGQGVNIGECISFGVEQLKRNLVFHVVAVLLINVIGSMTCYILTGPMMLGYFSILLRTQAGEAGAEDFSKLFEGFQRIAPAIVAGILSMLLITAGSFLCVIPGLLVAPVLPLSILFVAQGENDGVQAIKKAFECLKANLVMGAVTMFVLCLVGMLGALACFVGVLFTAPIATAGMFKLAQQMSAAPQAQA